ncbi:lysine transporter LysE [Salipiger aestuarii]|uniref:Threonine/homoserine/homoserine lactone efflux protein n=1 Tax=Salipiger aestuarii TaxID=568098 RepID=A0A327YM71_9RHOB|nr:LysE family translocator [Salipiger aestuarii]KAB2542888.1 lysine transporter LysE [Salipiger aestuarii]RAK20805.1 threonine/homoserine/homoserine lactone efflux protein [Salipiger aestuarii]
MPLDLWLTFVAASTALLLLPGPTVLLVLSYALSKGRPVALASAAGVAFGDFVAMTLSLAGLGTLILASSTLFVVLKWIGAIWLIWLGLKLLRSAPGTGVALPETAITGRGVFGHTAAVTALNPKSIGFFIAFVPQFVDTTAPLLGQFAILVATFVTLAAMNALAYALAADRLRRVIARPSVLVWLTRAGGTALIGMGLLTATLRRSS